MYTLILKSLKLSTAYESFLLTVPPSPLPPYSPMYTHPQETSLLEEMKKKLRSSEVHVMQVEGANERLSRTLSELEEKYRQSVGEIR